MKILFDSNALNFLGEINLSKNKITQMGKIIVPRLFKLNLDENQINSCESFTGHDNLQVLMLKKNKLSNMKGISNCKKLKILYVNENQIPCFNKDIKDLPELQKINFKLNP